MASDDDAAADVSKFAGSAAAGLGVKGGGAKDDAAHHSSDAGGSGTPHRERVPESERLATQFGVSDLASGLVLHADPSQVVDETVIIGQAQPLLEAGAAMSGPSGGLASQLAHDTAPLAESASAARAPHTVSRFLSTTRLASDDPSGHVGGQSRI